MSTPLTGPQMRDLFVRAGLKVDAIPGYETHDRSDETGLRFGPVIGIAEHHTGSNRPAGQGHAWCLSYARFLYNGRSDLPGSLCHWGTCPCGIVIMTGSGRTNHAGRMAVNTYSAVLNDAAPLDREISPGPDALDGNDMLYGNEIMYSGASPMTGPQYQATVIASAAICKHHGWTGRSVIGHREVTGRKPDPASHRLNVIRTDVNTALRGVVTKKEPEAPPMTNYVCAGTVPSEGGKIFLLVPGRPPRHLSPPEWQHITRVTPYWAPLPGSPFYESQIMELNALIGGLPLPQPGQRLASLEEPEGGGATLGDCEAHAHLMRSGEESQDGCPG